MLSNTSLVIAQEILIFSTIENSVNAEISASVMQEAYSRIGIKVKIERLPAARALVKSNNGEVDGELYRVVNVHKKWKNLLMVPTPVNFMEGVVMTKNTTFSVNGWESLRPYKIGVRKGIRFSDEGTKGMNRRELHSNQSLLNFLNMNRADIIVITRANGLKVREKLNLTELKILEPSVEVNPLYHYLHKKHKALVPIIDTVLQKMKNEGLIEEIRERFISNLSKPHYPPQE